MNKKGFMFNFIFGLIGLFVIILILAVLIPIQQGSVEEESVYTILTNVSSNVLSHFKTNETNGAIINVAYSFINFILYSSLEVVKAGVKYSVENPSFVNAKTLLWIVILSLITPIIYYVFMMVIIIFLLVKEWYLNKKEKKYARRI